ncbi:MAG: tetratricopeptide repeat protein [Pirellulaceae bacterium]|nr:tetratricopeptide repeat protein [Pirellulaceae bacterium]
MISNRLATLFAQACQCHHEGNLQAAEQGYREILAADPSYFEVLHRLGILAAQLGHAQAAIELIQQAIQLSPARADFYTNLGLALVGVDQLDDAVLANSKALQLAPNNPDAHFNLGVIYQRQGESEAAVSAYLRAIEFRPEFFEAIVNLGNVYKALGQSSDAKQCFLDAIKVNPNAAEAHYNLASSLHQESQHQESIASYERAIAIHPGYAMAHHNLGTVYSDLGRFREAIVSYRKAVALEPNNADRYYNLCVAYYALNDKEAATECIRQALSLSPEHVEANYYQALILKDQKQHEAAIEVFRRVLSLRPGYGECDLMNVLQLICKWGDLEDIARHIVALVERGQEEKLRHRASPLTFIGLPIVTTAEQQFQCAKQWADNICSNVSKPLSQPPRCLATQPNGRIRIGYLSADFRNHPVGLLIPEWIESHDRSGFEIFGYSLGVEDSSPQRQRLVKAFDHFIDLQSLNFFDAAQRIQNDGIDILVDLQGYTSKARTQILAHRPAPIQINYLGFAGTLGGDFVDYILVDDFVVPADQAPFFSEQLVHLPGCFMVNDSQRAISARTPQRIEVGLPENSLVLCGFSTSAKITPKMFDVWCRLLKAIPESVLWLRADNPVAVVNLQREAEIRGVTSDRLVFAPTIEMPDHLARYPLADIFLDTFPYNQHSSASDVLRMGVPMVTLSGNTFVSRVAGSFLRTLGLPELITGCFEQYEDVVMQLANDRENLNVLRRRLATNLSHADLLDGRAFARKVEHAYRTMCQRQPISGAKP